MNFAIILPHSVLNPKLNFRKTGFWADLIKAIESVIGWGRYFSRYRDLSNSHQCDQIGRFWAQFFYNCSPSLFFVYFQSFSNKHYNVSKKTNLKKCLSSIRCWDLNTQLSAFESHPKTIRPGLKPNTVTLFRQFSKHTFYSKATVATLCQLLKILSFYLFHRLGTPATAVCVTAKRLRNVLSKNQFSVWNKPFSSCFNYLFLSVQNSWQNVYLKFADDLIRTTDFLCRKRLLFQLIQNNCPNLIRVCYNILDEF